LNEVIVWHLLILPNDGRYTQLVEQFAAVSYGDELFGHFVLVPLQQCHSPSYRKLVWSEHAAVLRVLRTQPEQVISYVIVCLIGM
jgi:hypothetical protein